MVAPHGVERNTNFLGHGETIPCHREPQQGAGRSSLPATLAFLERGERGEWIRRILASRR
jgi:hypothetical protein